MNQKKKQEKLPIEKGGMYSRLDISPKTLTIMILILIGILIALMVWILL